MNDTVNIVQKGNLFKLVLGAGNEYCENIKELVEIYSHTSVDIFDMNPSAEIIQTVTDTIRKSGREREDFLFCVSLVVEGDKHSQKAVIDSKKCTNCKSCISKCPQDAIYFDSLVKIDEKKCIGCECCAQECIEYKSTVYENFDEMLETIKQYNIDIVELHISSSNRDAIFTKWKKIINNFDGLLSICVDRTHFSDCDLVETLDKMIAMTDKERIIIQADGNPMSGSEDTYASTLQAIACADLVKDLGTHIFISGGTNSKTPKLAKMCNIRYNGITVGSYARKIIKNITHTDAVKIANEFVNKIKRDFNEG